MTTVFLITATVLTALIAGLFYAYSCSVVLGLGKLSDSEYLRAMQSINREILNPVFFVSFIGAAILLPVTAFLFRGQQPAFIFLMLASVAYLIGVFGVTVAGNVPLNDLLGKFDIAGSSAEAVKQMRETFENRWNFLNNIRTVFSVISIVLAVCACIWNKEI
ncbi:anthrone oxygenase family protein [Chryseobacterium sp. 2987]|uniref:chryseobasin maturation helper ChrI n=1 Tax=Chryseobacterium sp. 2987 TaxID=2817767 RepID=UPI00285E9023|nr:anthrone oxygenase family protein [Chryseobacterium sp. 2987]MDR6922300.1 putative membrane protein [Chryseobacterium sp. 2987]